MLVLLLVLRWCGADREAAAAAAASAVRYRGGWPWVGGLPDTYAMKRVWGVWSYKCVGGVLSENVSDFMDSHSVVGGLVVFMGFRDVQKHVE